MTDREKLVKLLDEAHDNYYKSFDPNRDFYGMVADHLIANGVTFATDTNVGSKWEPVSDPPPTGEVLAYSQKSGGMAVGCIVVALWNDDMEEVEFACENGLEPLFDVTHWMPKPMPPEED